LQKNGVLVVVCCNNVYTPKVSEWAERLRRILGREEDPGFELLTEIDAILARPARRDIPSAPGQDLFG
jgi:hypothetical protein